MIVSISQPTLFSWIGYYNIIKNSDVFVFLDNVKFEKRSWLTRNRIKTVTKDAESPTWITIPTKDTSQDVLIKDTLIDNNQNWKGKHLKMFKSLYGNSYEDFEFIKDMYQRDWERLSDFSIEFIMRCCKFLDIKTKILKASEMDVHGKKSSLLLDICRKLNATEYLTSVGAKEYLEKDKQIFENIKIKYHNYKHPKYQQRGKIFLENLSILDLLFNEKENSKKFV